VVLEQVPNLVGDNLVTGEQVLIQNGLAIGSISRQASNLPAGTIVRTNPRANTAVPAGTTINLVVAG
jgi:beta-lactam-binding protein with PASTA domain